MGWITPDQHMLMLCWWRVWYVSINQKLHNESRKKELLTSFFLQFNKALTKLKLCIINFSWKVASYSCNLQNCNVTILQGYNLPGFTWLDPSLFYNNFQAVNEVIMRGLIF